jgi:hypothetical protein
MSEEITLILPKPVAEALRRRAENQKLTVEELILRAVVRILEEERGI